MADENKQEDQPIGDGGGKPTDDKAPTYKTFDEFMAAQSEEVRKLHEENEAGLRSALSKERTERETLAKDLRDAAKAAGENTALKAQLEDAANKMDEAQRKADFYEAASAAGIKNPRLAYIAAKADDLFDRKGQPDFVGLKSRYPEFFGTTTQPAGSPGAGRRGTGPTARTMDDIIRGKQ